MLTVASDSDRIFGGPKLSSYTLDKGELVKPQTLGSGRVRFLGPRALVLKGVAEG